MGSVILPQPLKGLTMATPNPINPGKRSLRSRLFNRSTVLAFVAGAAVAVGVGVGAQGAGMGAWHHGSMMDGTHSAADVNAHVDHMLKLSRDNQVERLASIKMRRDHAAFGSSCS